MLTLTLVALSITVLAAAAPQADNSPCSVGSVQCCQSTETAGSPTGTFITALLGIAAPDATSVLGINCSPISAIAIGSKGACSANAVCCEDNSVSTLVSFGCVPMIL